MQGSSRVVLGRKPASVVSSPAVATPRGGHGKVATTPRSARGAGISTGERESRAAEELRELLGPCWQELSAASVKQIVAWKLKDAPKSAPQEIQKRFVEESEAAEQDVQRRFIKSASEPEAEGTLDELTRTVAAIR